MEFNKKYKQIFQPNGITKSIQNNLEEYKSYIQENYTINEQYQILKNFFNYYENDIKYYEKNPKNKFVTKKFLAHLQEEEYFEALSLMFQLQQFYDKEKSYDYINEFLDNSLLTQENIILRVSQILNKYKKVIKRTIFELSEKRKFLTTSLKQPISMNTTVGQLVSIEYHVPSYIIIENIIKEDFVKTFNRRFDLTNIVYLNVEEIFLNRISYTLTGYKKEQFKAQFENIKNKKINEIIKEDLKLLFQKYEHIYKFINKNESQINTLKNLYQSVIFNFDIGSHIVQVYEKQLLKVNKDIKKANINNIDSFEPLSYGGFKLVLKDIITYYQKYNTLKGFYPESYFKTVSSVVKTNKYRQQRFICNIYIILKYFGILSEYENISKNYLIDEQINILKVEKIINVLKQIIKIEDEINYVNLSKDLLKFRKEE